jgi:putative sterol carrier protein
VHRYADCFDTYDELGYTVGIHPLIKVENTQSNSVPGGRASMTPAEIFAQMPQAFLADKAGDLRATFQFSLSGEGGNDWAVTVADGTCTVVEGKADKPSITIGMAADDFVKMVDGELQPVTAFMQGNIKLQGDMNLAIKLQEVFDW